MGGSDSRFSGAISERSSSPVPPRNPYRAILRRDYPEPFIALLVFILGIWLWDHYFGKPQGYPPGTEEVALVKIDRDLRLAETMGADPAWLRWLAGADEPARARENARIALESLIREQAIGLRGLEAFAVLKADQTGRPAREMLVEMMRGESVMDFGETARRLASHRGTWWEARLVEDWEKSARPEAMWQQAHGADSRQIRNRAILARSAVWLIALVGLAFVPHALRELRAGFSRSPGGYGDAWPLPLGLVVFLVSTLAWIGFTMTLEIGISALPGLHPALGILLDSAARLLPALIALGLLFRRPSHAVRALGLDRPAATRAILGLFTLLMLIDQALRAALGTGADSEPGGGLSAGEAGLWGLAFGVVSACLLAPVAEEILYRGVLFRSLRNRLGLLVAALLSSAVFAVLHFYNGYGLASVGVFGCACALFYASRTALCSCILLHMLYNTSIKLPEWIIYHAPLG
jgi:membrane protease YdiL (CAAX protease family)